MDLFHVINDVSTGETTMVPFTQVEREAYEARMAALSAVAYQGLRAGEYPPISDYIDGIVKGDQEQVDGYIAACLAVKAKYPKPN